MGLGCFFTQKQNFLISELGCSIDFTLWNCKFILGEMDNFGGSNIKWNKCVCRSFELWVKV